MALSVRTRFEVFKRDEFTCQYCGRKSPDVVALNRNMTKNLKYVAACCRNWRYEHTATKDMRGDYE
jgi:hypothetical protein